MAEIELHHEVVQWLDTLPDHEWQRVVVIVDRLAEQGHQARMPLSQSLGARLFELRFTLGPTARRITYRFAAFRKHRNNERHEIDRARIAAAQCALRYP